MVLGSALTFGRAKIVVATLVAIFGSGCSTSWRLRPATDDPDTFHEVSSALMGNDVTVEVRPTGEAPPVRAQADSPVGQAASEPSAGATAHGNPDGALAPRPPMEKVALRVEGLDRVAIRGETANGPRSLPLSDVRSISYRRRAATAIAGALVGLTLGGVIGFTATAAAGPGCNRGDYAGLCIVGGLIGAGTGVLVGGIVGALMGDDVRVLVESPPQMPSTSSDGRSR